MTKIKMIIIGANGSGYKRTIPAMKDSEICEIVAIQSRNGEKLKSICKEYGFEVYCENITIDKVNWISFKVIKEKSS